MNLCITPEARLRLIKSTKEVLFKQDTGFAPHHSTHLGTYDDRAGELVDNFIDDLDSFTPTLTY